MTQQTQPRFDISQVDALLRGKELPRPLGEFAYIGLRDGLSKLQTAPAVWRYDAPGADLNVFVHLSQRRPLDEQLRA